MSPDLAVNVGRWYLRWDKNEIFQVTGQDAGTGQITIRTYDGNVDCLSLDQWRTLNPGLADPPCDWTGPEETVDELEAGASLPPGFSTELPVVNARIERILVGLKEVTGRQSAALSKATQIARATGAQIELFHCVDIGLTPLELATCAEDMEGFEGRQRGPWEQGLARLAAEVRRQGVRVSCSAPVDYPIHEAILRRARRFHADLIVTDAHFGPNIAPSMSQEVDWELVRLSPVPVLIVRRQEPYDHPVVLAALDPAQKHSKPATLDGKILAFAEVCSNLLQGQLHAVHAYPFPAAYIEASAASSAGVAAELQAMDVQRAQSALDTLLTSASKDLPQKQRHVLPGAAADAIVRAATEANASIVVMGSVARTGISGLFIGNTAEKVLGRIHCDLLLLKPDGFRNSIPDQRRGARLISTGMFL